MSERSLSRRHFLGAAAAAAGGVVLGGPVVEAARRTAASSAGAAVALDGAFRQGIASGQPAPDAITLWTRLEELERASRLQVEVSPDRDFRRIIARKNVVAGPDSGYTVNTRVSVRALRPGEQYFYRFYTCNESSPVGRFKTARPADSREPVRIGFFSCQEFDSGFYTAHAALAQESDLDLVVCLGDYIYEKGFEDRPVREDSTGANRDGEVQTLPEYRDKYSLYHTDQNLLAVRAAHPMMAIWDDHEVEDNYAAGRPGGQTDDRRIPYPQRQANAYRAFFEYMPRIRERDDADRIIGRLPLGANADVFLLDTRRFRDDQPCSPSDRGFQPCPPAVRADPSRTLLGGGQKAWLLNGLAGSQATWKVVANQIMIMALDVPRTSPLNTDQWDGYEAERRELLEFVQGRGIRDVTFVTGDIHTFFAGNVSPSGRQDELGTPGAAATEFVGGAISSKGIADQFGEPPADAVAIPSDESVYFNNPHIRFSNQRFKGYGVLEARPDELLVQYRAVETTQSPDSGAFTLASFRVASGTPRVEVLDQPAGARPLPQGGPARARRRRRQGRRR